MTINQVLSEILAKIIHTTVRRDYTMTKWDLFQEGKVIEYKEIH